MERKLPWVDHEHVHDLGIVPRNGLTCGQCQSPVERLVRLVLPGRRFELQLCTYCAGTALGWSREHILAAMAEYDDECKYAAEQVAYLLAHLPCSAAPSELLAY